MHRLLSVLFVLSGLSVQAGIVTRTDGSKIEGALKFVAGKGLQLTSDGKSEIVIPGSNRSIEIQASDAIWSESFRKRLKSGAGLLGTYFERTNLDGPRRTRIDKGIDFQFGGGGPFKGWREDHFSIRWEGTFEVPHTGEHTFFTDSDDGVRVSINDKRIIDNWTNHSVIENKGVIKLDKGKPHKILVEYFESTGEAVIELEWDGPEHKRQDLSKLDLRPPNDAQATYRGPDIAQTGLKNGVILRDGSYLAARVNRANDTAMILESPFKDLSISTLNVARVVFRDIPLHTAVKVRPSRLGALMVGGDFVDGDFKSLEKGNLKLSSLLFGYQTLDTKYETMALQLRIPKAEPSAFRVQLLNGSVLLADKVEFTEDSLNLSSSVLESLRIPLDQIHIISMGKGEELYPTSVNLGPDSIHAKKSVQAPKDERRKAENLLKLAAREKDKRARDQSRERSKMNSEDAALRAAKAKLEDYEGQLKAAEDTYAKAQKAYDEAKTSYTKKESEYRKSTSAYTNSDRDYRRAKTYASRADSDARRFASALKSVQSHWNRYQSKFSDKDKATWKAKLTRAEKDRKAADELNKKRENEERQAKSKRDQAKRNSDNLKRDLYRIKSDRDRKKSTADSTRRRRDYLKNQVATYSRNKAAAQAKVTARAKDDLR
ncbi:MAG: hypothetical protein CMO80_24855 [Verrucomicrobiales bacterium]|nr:hypothetical protein [Verrucomicrobiales bacterium]|tara:strand:- start:1395 stop:3371 length:1977 start_codon:yes stop_codon:yes gene_type:complete